MALSETGRQLQSGDITTVEDSGQMDIAQSPYFAFTENILGETLYLRMIESDSFIRLEGLLESFQYER